GGSGRCPLLGDGPPIQADVATSPDIVGQVRTTGRATRPEVHLIASQFLLLTRNSDGRIVELAINPRPTWGHERIAEVRILRSRRSWFWPTLLSLLIAGPSVVPADPGSGLAVQLEPPKVTRATRANPTRRFLDLRGAGRALCE